MTAMPKPEPPQRRNFMYESVLEQMANHTEERATENILKIKRSIGLYERIYGMLSDEMRRKVAAGEMEETNEICEWSEYLQLVERFHSRDKHGAG
jgi:hypothetical protein